MNAEQLRHLLRAAAKIIGEKEFTVIGSQSILGSHPDAPRSLRKSIEGDTYPKYRPGKSIDIDGAIGELSVFHQEFGYYAHGVAPETATLPEGWEKRLVEFRVNDPTETIGWCLEKHDLTFSKLAAGRPKDIEFIRELLKHRLIILPLFLPIPEIRVNSRLKTLPRLTNRVKQSSFRDDLRPRTKDQGRRTSDHRPRHALQPLDTIL